MPSTAYFETGILTDKTGLESAGYRLNPTNFKDNYDEVLYSVDQYFYNLATYIQVLEELI